MKTNAHIPTASERKHGRATCRCGKQAALVYGCKPNSYALCEEHNAEHVVELAKLEEQSRTNSLCTIDQEKLVNAGVARQEPKFQCRGGSAMPSMLMLYALAAMGAGMGMPSRRR